MLSLAGFLLAAVPARAQFVEFTRCHGAYPCNRPFMIQYNPDPLIAGPYGSAPPASAVSAHVELKANPKVQLDNTAPLPLSGDAVGASVKAFVKRYPTLKAAPPKDADAKEAEAKPAEPAPGLPRPQI